MVDLFEPLVRKGVDRSQLRAVFWYNRRRNVFRLALGRSYAQLSGFQSYETCQKSVDLKFFSSGLFSDYQLTESNNQETEKSNYNTSSVVLLSGVTENSRINQKNNPQFVQRKQDDSRITQILPQKLI